jgi:hypothetical protein
VKRVIRIFFVATSMAFARSVVEKLSVSIVFTLWYPSLASASNRRDVLPILSKVRNPFFKKAAQQFRQVIQIIITDFLALRNSVPIFKAFTAAGCCRVLSVRNGSGCLVRHWSLKSVVPWVRWPNCRGQVFLHPFTEALSALSSRMIQRALTECDMPEKVPDLFQLEHRERVPHLAGVSAMNSLPINELGSALPTNANTVLRYHLLSCLKAMKTIAAIGIGAANVQLFL